MTSKQLTYLGIGIGALGLAYEFFLSPSAKLSIAHAKAAGKPLGPLGSRPLTSGTTAPIIPAKASSATAYTQGNPSGLATRPTNTSAGMSLGAALPGLISGLGRLFSSNPQVSSAPKPSSGGSSFGGGSSSAGGGYGKPSAQGSAFNAGNLSAAGASPSGSTAYADSQGFVAYPNGDGTYSDEQGNQVYIDANGQITYDPTESVGYVVGDGITDGSDGVAFDASSTPDAAVDPNGDGSYLGDYDTAAVSAISPGEGVDASGYDASDVAGVQTDDFSSADLNGGGDIPQDFAADDF